MAQNPAPKPGRCQRPVVIVLENGPIHTKKATRAALAARAHWLSIELPPKYAPELNDIETVWRDLKAHYLAHQTFTDTDVLDQAIHHAVEALNLERKANPLANQRISAWVLWSPRKTAAKQTIFRAPMTTAVLSASLKCGPFL
jgi:transposase